MVNITFPIAIRWELPDELADAIRQQHHPYRLGLFGRGTRGVWLEVLVLPIGTIPLLPVDPPPRAAAD